MSEQAPMSDDAYVELFKLEKLFEARFSLRSSIEGATDAPESPVAAQVACCHDSLEASVLLRPTDPGFSVANIGGESGIRMRLRLHRSQREAANKQPHPSQPAHPDTAAKPTQAGVEGCGTAAAAPVAAYVLQQASDIDIGNAAIAHDVKLVIKKVMLTFMTKYKTSQKYAVYECLKFLDRELCRIFELYGPRKGCAASNSSGGTTGGGNRDAGVADVTWSLQEQKCLEYALTKSKDLGDPAQRWAAVAKVVKTKTPEECRRRFQRCREQLLTKANEVRFHFVVTMRRRNKRPWWVCRRSSRRCWHGASPCACWGWKWKKSAFLP
ncbi:CHY zinc finger protein [Babesia caballi]|uniref:CHY zinc finger protein n=1 Tax=Babesia caballi TaxID=5871 RepID=A0AAV4M0G7_BABCB|nr:CHY zinc finger protein [Babesia caballi]